MALSRERKTDIIVLAADMLTNARADRLTRDAVETVGPGRMYPAMPQSEIDALADLLEGTIVYFEQGPDGMLRVTPR